MPDERKARSGQLRLSLPYSPCFSVPLPRFRRERIRSDEVARWIYWLRPPRVFVGLKRMPP